MVRAGNVQGVSERHFVAVCFIFVYFFVASGAGRAAESRQTWQVDWEKTLKAAEAEGEVTVYVVDYPRFTVSQFQKAYPRIRFPLDLWPRGEPENIKPTSILADKGRMFRFYIRQRR
jgi:hypothetical protein